MIWEPCTVQVGLARLSSSVVRVRREFVIPFKGVVSEEAEPTSLCVDQKPSSFPAPPDFSHN